MNRIVGLVGCLFWTFPWSFFNSPILMQKRMKKKWRGNILVIASSASLQRSPIFLTSCVELRERIQTTCYSCLTLHRSESFLLLYLEACLQLIPIKATSVAWRRLRRWRMPSSLHMAVLVVVWCRQIFKPLSFCFHKVNACWTDGVSYNALPFN